MSGPRRESAVERLPQLFSSAEVADLQQGVQRVFEFGVAGAAAFGPALDGADEQAVSCVDVPVGAKQYGGGRARGLERPFEFWVDSTDFVQQPGCAVQLTGDVCTNIGGGGQPSVSVEI